MPLGYDHFPLSQIAEVLGDFHLRLTENFLKVADAERALRQQVQDAQTRPVTKALVDLDQVHLWRLHLSLDLRRAEITGAKVQRYFD